MSKDNVFAFPGKVDIGGIETSKDPDAGVRNLKKSYCDVQANEMFRIVMRMIEQSGAMEHLDTSDEDMFNDLQPRLIMLKEVIYSIYCFLENTDYELDVVYDALFNPMGIYGDEFTTEIVATFDPKYKQQLIDFTQKYIKENNG